MRIRAHAAGMLVLLLVLSLGAGLAQGSGPGAGPSPLAADAPDAVEQLHMAEFGMNIYATSPGRSDSEVDDLLPLAAAIGVEWSREQITWDSFSQAWGPAFFDGRLGKLEDANLDVVGMLVTTPEAYSTAECRTYAASQGYPPYFCPPANPADFGAFAGQVAERYDGETPGLPRISVWEIWNEPDQPATLVIQPGQDRGQVYAGMLCAAYAAIKAVDPQAVVLVGGLTGWQTVGYQGFMDSVVAAGGWNCFDGLAYHPLILGYPPEEPNRDWNIPSRLEMVRDWLNAHGGGKLTYATEFGWSTCDPGVFPNQCNTPDEQASYTVRMYGLLMHYGYYHNDLFQFKHLSIGGMPSPYRECEIITDPNYTTKPAYTAYGVMTSLLRNSAYIGTGPLHSVNDTWDDRYDIKFRRQDGALVDLLWQLRYQTAYSFHVEPGVEAVYLYDRDGSLQLLTPVGGQVTVTLSSRPRYLVRWVTGTVYSVFLPLVWRY